MIQCTMKTILIITIVIIVKKISTEAKDVNDSRNIALQKLLLVYTNGHFVTLNWSLKSALVISQRGFIERDSCGYYGFSKYNIQLLTNDNIENKTRALNQQLSLKTAKVDHLPFATEIDSTMVETRNYIWMIGESSMDQFNFLYEH